MTAKELKQLANACRAVGITTFEGEGVKFTLGPAPAKARKAAKEETAEALNSFEKAVQDAQKPAVKTVSTPIESDTPTEEELLFWSSGGVPDDEASV